MRVHCTVVMTVFRSEAGWGDGAYLTVLVVFLMLLFGVAAAPLLWLLILGLWSTCLLVKEAPPSSAVGKSEAGTAWFAVAYACFSMITDLYGVWCCCFEIVFPKVSNDSLLANVWELAIELTFERAVCLLEFRFVSKIKCLETCQK